MMIGPKNADQRKGNAFRNASRNPMPVLVSRIDGGCKGSSVCVATMACSLDWIWISCAHEGIHNAMTHMISRYGRCFIGVSFTVRRTSVAHHNARPYVRDSGRAGHTAPQWLAASSTPQIVRLVVHRPDPAVARAACVDSQLHRGSIPARRGIYSHNRDPARHPASSPPHGD